MIKIKKRRVQIGNRFIYICTIFVLSLFCFFFLFVPRVKFNSFNETININSKYEDKGISIYNIFGNKKLIKSTGNIDTKRNANYKIQYKYNDNLFTYNFYKNIKVKDIESPKITLLGNSIEYICKSSKYKEQGFSAYDNFDKDITDKVKVTKRKDEIIYEVVDSSGNKSKTIRKIYYKDVIKPTITLNGDTNIFIPLGSNYIEEGYIAYDNCDLDITSLVKTTNNINNTKIGNYKINYIVKDKSNNKTTVTRNIYVKEPLKTNTIYLTFDDGPREDTTNIILDILKEKGVKATFFVTNNGSDSLIKRIAFEGHSIGIHTASHRYDIIYSSVDNYFNDLELVKDRIYNITGINTKLLRFPGGSGNTISKKYSEGIMSKLVKDVIDNGYLYYDWNIDSGDSYSNNTTSSIYNNVVNNLSHDKYNVILMHDTKINTKDTLSKIIDYGISNGYNFDTINENDMIISHKVNN